MTLQWYKKSELTLNCSYEHFRGFFFPDQANERCPCRPAPLPARSTRLIFTTTPRSTRRRDRRRVRRAAGLDSITRDSIPRATRDRRTTPGQTAAAGGSSCPRLPSHTTSENSRRRRGAESATATSISRSDSLQRPMQFLLHLSRPRHAFLLSV